MLKNILAEFENHLQWSRILRGYGV
jgi:hypothetical protein